PAGGSLSRVVATRFDVRVLNNEHFVRVVVTHGQVRFARAQSADPGPLLAAGDLARLGVKGDPKVTRAADTTRLVSWTRGTLVFNRTPMREALAELSRWYDVDLSVASGSADDRTFTATLTDQSL